MAHRVAAFLFAWACAAAIGVAASTLMVMNALRGLGAGVDMATFGRMVVHDLEGVGPVYAPVIGAALLSGCLVAGVLQRYAPRGWAFVLCGAGAMAVALSLLQQIVHVQLLAGARDAAGLAAQMAAGAVGGLLYALIGPRPKA